MKPRIFNSVHLVVGDETTHHRSLAAAFDAMRTKLVPMLMDDSQDTAFDQETLAFCRALFGRDKRK
jgi:hypothetical protein